MSFTNVFHINKDMAEDTFIFNIKKRPSKFAFMVAIPFWMYRIQSNKFTDGLNFFQRTVLKFLAKPGISVDTISDFMGVDKKLVALIVDELKNKKYIDADNILTEEGKYYRKCAMGLVIDEGNKQIGYVFQMRDREDYYPFYVNNIEIVSSYLNKERDLGIIVEADENHDEYRSRIFLLSVNEREEVIAPNERDILQLMENTCKSRKVSEDVIEDTVRKCDKLKIDFLPDDCPENVYICTYVYLEKLGKNLYNQEWKVLNPFEDGCASPNLKFYLQSLQDKSFQAYLQEQFKDAYTDGDATWSDGEKEIEKKLDLRMIIDFGEIKPIPSDPHNNLESWLRTVVEYHLKYVASDYKKVDCSHMIITYTQRIVELIFKIDSQERSNLYWHIQNNFFREQEVNRYGKTKWRNKNLYNDSSFTQSMISAIDWLMPSRKRNNDDVYKKLTKTARRYDNRDGLIKSLYILILEAAYNHDKTLFAMIDIHLDFILDKCSQRNLESHATLDAVPVLSKEDTEAYYNFIRTFINDYTKYRNSL